MAAFSAYLRTGTPEQRPSPGDVRPDRGHAHGGRLRRPGRHSGPSSWSPGRRSVGSSMRASSSRRPMAVRWPGRRSAASLSTEADIAAEGAATAAGADFVFDEVTLGAYKYTVRRHRQPPGQGVGGAPAGRAVRRRRVRRPSPRRAHPPQAVVRRRAGLGLRGAAGHPVRHRRATSPRTPGSVPTYAKLKDLEHELDPAYRQGASFLMNDTTWGVLEQIVDTIGRPIVAPLLQGIVDGPNRMGLFGYPVIIDQACANGVEQRPVHRVRPLEPGVRRPPRARTSRSSSTPTRPPATSSTTPGRAWTARCRTSRPT